MKEMNRTQWSKKSREERTLIRWEGDIEVDTWQKLAMYEGDQSMCGSPKGRKSLVTGITQSAKKELELYQNFGNSGGRWVRWFLFEVLLKISFLVH